MINEQQAIVTILMFFTIPLILRFTIGIKSYKKAMKATIIIFLIFFSLYIGYREIYIRALVFILIGGIELFLMFLSLFKKEKIFNDDNMAVHMLLGLSGIIIIIIGIAFSIFDLAAFLFEQYNVKPFNLTFGEALSATTTLVSTLSTVIIATIGYVLGKTKKSNKFVSRRRKSRL